MGRVCSFTVPGRPSRWMRPAQVVRKGRVVRITDPKAAAEKKTIAQYAKLAWKGPPVCGPVQLSVEAVFAIPKSWGKELQAEALAGRVPHIADPDLDQIEKQAQDAMTGIVYWDDNQVCRRSERSMKRYGNPERTVITIEVFDQLESQKTPGQRDLERAAASGQLVSGQRRPARAQNSRSKTGSK